MAKQNMNIFSRNRRLTDYERLSTRIGYLGTGFLLTAHWLIQPELYIVGFICMIIQVASRKQWNLVIIAINGLLAWINNLLTI
tara:strand:- start:392 stop:640 length:249 start_codon:yes stop_codon:yes gene_type:complete